MKLDLQITMTDGTVHEVSAGVPDIVSWELKNNKKISDWQNGVGMADMTFLAWNFLSRKKITELKYDIWLLNVDSVEAVVDDPKAIDEEV